MRIVRRLRRSIISLRYKFVSIDELIARIGTSASERNKHSLIEVLKERLAHQDGSLEAVDWSDLHVSGIMLSSSKLPQAQFKGGKLAGAYFGYSDLRAAKFAGADLREAHFREADLSAANFDGATLRGANLARANLQSCSLVAADLTGANLWGADLRGANLVDAELANCCMTAILVDESTCLPDDPVHTASNLAAYAESNEH